MSYFIKFHCTLYFAVFCALSLFPLQDLESAFCVIFRCRLSMTDSTFQDDGTGIKKVDGHKKVHKN